jgi:LysR family transcriptional regulator, transcriptional activator for dmlA
MRKTGEPHEIQIFVAVSDAGTLRGAAEDLGLPTSTVSRSLTRLEKRLDLLLARRSQRGVVLTDSGKKYLQSCKRALQILREGAELLDDQRSKPAGILRVACPLTMAQYVIAPLLSKFMSAYPDLRVELQAYSSGWDQEPREDVDVFFKIRAPRDLSRKVRCYPGTLRGLFATRSYLDTAGTPSDPADLTSHRCIGWDVWKLSKVKRLWSLASSFK